MTDETIDIPFDPPPRHCINPRCRVPLRKAFPQCPSCQEPLTPAALKARAERAVANKLGLVKPPPEAAGGTAGLPLLTLVRSAKPGRARVLVQAKRETEDAT